MRNLLFGPLILISIIGCDKEEPTNEIINPSTRFAVCNQIVSERCRSYSGEYCLFGFKFGEDPAFLTFGVNRPGPQSDGGTVTFSFQEDNDVVNTHRQVNIPSKSFDNLLSCSKTQIRKALNDWSAVASIEFEELPENSLSDLKFYVADISTGGVGYPNFSESPCDKLAGHVILHPDFTSNCEGFYLYVLHEIGHALGLGHSARDNIMGADLRNTTLEGLQPGDIKGMQQIYGEK